MTSNLVSRLREWVSLGNTGHTLCREAADQIEAMASVGIRQEREIQSLRAENGNLRAQYMRLAERPADETNGNESTVNSHVRVDAQSGVPQESDRNPAPAGNVSFPQSRRVVFRDEQGRRCIRYETLHVLEDLPEGSTAVRDPDQLCKCCRHSYGQHVAGPVGDGPCQHCTCPSFVPYSPEEPTPEDAAGRPLCAHGNFAAECPHPHTDVK